MAVVFRANGYKNNCIIDTAGKKHSHDESLTIQLTGFGYDLRVYKQQSDSLFFYAVPYNGSRKVADKSICTLTAKIATLTAALSTASKSLMGYSLNISFI